ncbi:MAG: hypothetical protein AABY85_05130 [Gemmatimonadota bacterium]
MQRGTADRRKAKEDTVNLTLAVALMALVAWIVLGFLVPLGAGWVHLLLAAGVMLLVRRVVTGRQAW